MTDVKMGLNRRLVRAIYNKVDWDQYDREVVAESLPAYEEAAEALERLMADLWRYSFEYPYNDGELSAEEVADAALRRLRDTE